MTPSHAAPLHPGRAAHVSTLPARTRHRQRWLLAQLLRPLEATARRCGMDWQPPFAVYDVREPSPDALAAAGARYAAALAALAEDRALAA